MTNVSFVNTVGSPWIHISPLSRRWHPRSRQLCCCCCLLSSASPSRAHKWCFVPELEKKKRGVLEHRKEKTLISPLVFFLEMSLPLMHQIIRITSPLLFALALTAHVEQANTNLRALQEFWAQPILQCWA